MGFYVCGSIARLVMSTSRTKVNHCINLLYKIDCCNCFTWKKSVFVFSFRNILKKNVSEVIIWNALICSHKCNWFEISSNRNNAIANRFPESCKELDENASRPKGICRSKIYQQNKRHEKQWKIIDFHKNLPNRTKTFLRPKTESRPPAELSRTSKMTT